MPPPNLAAEGAAGSQPPCLPLRATHHTQGNRRSTDRANRHIVMFYDAQQCNPSDTTAGSQAQRSLLQKRTPSSPSSRGFYRLLPQLVGSYDPGGGDGVPL